MARRQILSYSNDMSGCVMFFFSSFSFDIKGRSLWHYLEISRFLMESDQKFVEVE